MYALLFIKTIFFFNDTATTEIYTLSLHDALPISRILACRVRRRALQALSASSAWYLALVGADRKSTRLNSSHLVISYAVFCLKKKKNLRRNPLPPSYCTIHHLLLSSLRTTS